MEAALLVVGVLAVFALAARRMVRRWDPPYVGVHERRGRHREREWQTGEYPLVKTSCDTD